MTGVGGGVPLRPQTVVHSGPTVSELPDVRSPVLTPSGRLPRAREAVDLPLPGYPNSDPFGYVETPTASP